MPLLLSDAWPRSRASGKYFALTSGPPCRSLQFTSLSKVPVWMQNSFASPLHSPQFSPQPAEERTRFLKMVEHTLLSRRSFHSWFVVEVGQASRSTMTGLHWSMMLYLNGSESTPGHLSTLNIYICNFNYSFSLYHKFCPMMMFWILLPNLGILLIKT